MPRDALTARECAVLGFLTACCLVAFIAGCYGVYLLAR